MLSNYLKPFNEVTIKNLFWGIFGKTRGSFEHFKITPCGCKLPKKIHFLQINRLKDFDNIGVENVGLTVLLTVKKLSIIKKGI